MSVRAFGLLGVAAILAGCGGSVMHLGESDNGPDGGTASGAGPAVTGSGMGSGTGFGTTGGTMGAGGSSAGEGEAGANCMPNAGPSTPLALTNLEYDNTLRDLLGYTGSPSTFLGPETRDGFSFLRIPANDASFAALRVKGYVDAAQRIAAEVALPQLDPSLGCGNPNTTPYQCADAFLVDFAFRAFRRPLTSDEKTSLLGVYQDAAATGSFEQGLRAVIQSVLQSPAFYVIEASGPAGLSPLSPYQLATRLSYFLTRSTPDRELLAAATSGSLSSPTGIEAEVRRLVSSPKAHGGIDD